MVWVCVVLASFLTSAKRQDKIRWVLEKRKHNGIHVLHPKRRACDKSIRELIRLNFPQNIFKVHPWYPTNVNSHSWIKPTYFLLHRLHQRKLHSIGMRGWVLCKFTFHNDWIRETTHAVLQNTFIAVKIFKLINWWMKTEDRLLGFTLEQTQTLLQMEFSKE